MYTSSSPSLILYCWWLSYPYRHFVPLWGSWSVCTHCQKCGILWLGKPGTFCVPNQILWDTKIELCKTHKTGTTLGKQANWMCNPNYILLLNTAAVTENWHAVKKKVLIFIDARVTFVSIKMAKFEGCT